MLDSLADRVVVEFDRDIAPGQCEVFVRSGASEDTCALDVPEAWTRPFPGETRIVPPASAIPAAALTTVSIYFSEPAASVGPDSVQIESGADTMLVDGRLGNPFLVRFELPESMRFAGPVVLQLPVGYVRGVNGGTWPKDSVYAIRLASPFADSTGEFQLTVPQPAMPEQLRFVLLLTSAASPTTAIRYPVDSGGVVEGRLPAGNYVISLWGDRDGDGHRNLGWPYPFRASDPVWRYGDTLQVRARFITELSLSPIGKK
jgi:hypothetical protein